ncbi:hypothetical protein VTL71DRAFT_683 [Oculimacula yallundae]|uniref:Uncharacterized protein n=1 Tax=Oculimacula yallundae TaxID=86028 RepID=A0ABR4D0W9_9HELO
MVARHMSRSDAFGRPTFCTLPTYLRAFVFAYTPIVISMPLFFFQFKRHTREIPSTADVAHSERKEIFKLIPLVLACFCCGFEMSHLHCNCIFPRAFIHYGTSLAYRPVFSLFPLHGGCQGMKGNGMG